MYIQDVAETREPFSGTQTGFIDRLLELKRNNIGPREKSEGDIETPGEIADRYFWALAGFYE